MAKGRKKNPKAKDLRFLRQPKRKRHRCPEPREFGLCFGKIRNPQDGKHLAELDWVRIIVNPVDGVVVLMDSKKSQDIVTQNVQLAVQAYIQATLGVSHVGLNCHQRLCQVSVVGVGTGDLLFF